MNQWLRARKWCDSHHDVFLDALRIYLGVALFVKGAVFIGNMGVLVETVSGNVPWTNAWMDRSGTVSSTTMSSLIRYGRGGTTTPCNSLPASSPAPSTENSCNQLHHSG